MNQSRGALAAAAADLLALLQTADAAQAHVETSLGRIGLSLPKLAALSVLKEAGESLSLGELAARLSCVKSNVTQLIDRLEADGFVSRALDPDDRRSRLAFMTPAGRAACERGARLRDQAARELFSDLTDDEARLLAALVGKLAARARC
jgi:DNA-binding MarR family transcriptional regulator